MSENAYLLVILVGAFCAIAVHELGHVLGLLLVRVPIKTIIIGVPTLIKLKVQNTQILFGLLPLGGAVVIDDTVAYALASWKSLISIGGGPLFSFITAFVVLLISGTHTPWQALNAIYQMVPVIIDLSIPFKSVNQGIMGSLIEMAGSNLALEAAYVFFSMNALLFIFNSIPFPGLDGGKFVLALVELLFGPKVKRYTNFLNRLGIIIVLAYIAVLNLSVLLQIYF